MNLVDRIIAIADALETPSIEWAFGGAFSRRDAPKSGQVHTELQSAALPNTQSLLGFCSDQQRRLVRNLPIFD